MEIWLNIGSATALMRLTIPVLRRGLVFSTAAFLFCIPAAAQQLAATLSQSLWSTQAGPYNDPHNGCNNPAGPGLSGKTDTVDLTVKVLFDDSVLATSQNVCDTITANLTVQVVTPQQPFALTEQQPPPPGSPFAGYTNLAQFTLAQSYAVNVSGTLTYTDVGAFGLSNWPVTVSLADAIGIPDVSCSQTFQPPPLSQTVTVGTVKVNFSCSKSIMYGNTLNNPVYPQVEVYITVGGPDINISALSYIVDFFYSVGAGAPPPPPTPSVMEALQMTQSFPTDLDKLGNRLYYNLPLIKGKSTVVRLYPLLANATAPVTAELNVTQGTKTTIFSPINGPVIPTAVVDRSGGGNGFTDLKALDFVIPGSMTNVAALTVSATFLVPPGAPPSTPLPTAPSPLPLQFVPQAKPFAVTYMPVCVPVNAKGPLCPTAAISDEDGFLSRILPVADGGVDYVPFLIPELTWPKELTNSTGWAVFRAYLRKVYYFVNALGAAGDQLVAWVPNGAVLAPGSDFGIDGVSDPPWGRQESVGVSRPDVGHVLFAVDYSPPLKPPYVPPENALRLSTEGIMALLIGHNLGLRKASSPCYPYATSTIQNAGFDAVDQVFVPPTAFDVESGISPLWVTPYTYDIFYRGGLQPQGDSINVKSAYCPAGQNAPATPPAAPAFVTARTEPKPDVQAAATAPVSSIILSGTITQSGTATFDPAYQMLTTAALDQSDPAGPYCIRFTGSGAATFCFNESFTDAETGDALNTAAFSFEVAFPSNTTSIDFLYQGNVTGSLPVSKNAPKVSFVSPAPNSQWSGGMQTIQWTASDADGGTLTYALLYSSDSGNTYTPMALDLTASPYTLDPSMIMGGSQVYFQVLASDGVNTTAATVGPVNVKQTPTVGPLPVFTVSARAGQSVQGSLLVGNTGSGPLTISSATIDNGAFLVIDPPVPFIIPADGQRSLTIQFLSSSVGTQTGTLTIASNDPSGPAKTSVSGQVFASTGPATQLNFGELDFGSVTVGQTASLPLMVYNAGGSNVVVSSVTFSNPSFTAVGLTTPLTVTAGSTGTITVQFAPTAANVAAGALTASMVINSNDPAYPAQTVILTGTGVAGGGSCTYSLSSGGQAFGPSSATGTITITTQAGCQWSVGQLPSWIALTSAGSGTGSGTVTFSIQPNSGADLSASITIGGTPFIIEQESAAIPGLLPVGSLAQVNSQGGWSFELDAVNLGSSAATTRVNFTDPNGNPLQMPLTFPQLAPTAGPELAATLDRTINPNARIVIDSSGSATAATLLGSGRLSSNGSVSGFGIFSFPAFNWNAVVPLETRKASTYSLPFDNTGVLATGVALSNITASAVSVQVTILNDAGTQIGTDMLNLPAQGYQQFMLNTQYQITAGKRGTIQFQTTSPGQISVLGVRANGIAALTTLPVLSNVDTPGGSISDLTYGGGFTSTFYLVNTGTSPASFTLSFYNQNGAPVSVPLLFPQTTSTQTTMALTQTLAAGQMLEVATQAAPSTSANVPGSAQLTTTGSVSGFEIFDYSPNGQEASVPLETRTPKDFVLVYDNTNGLSTGVALANASAAPANITANIYDDQGALLQSPTISLGGHAQQTIVLNTAYTATANKRGMVQFVVPPSGPISMIGIRVGTVGATTTTTIPILTTASTPVTLSVDGGTFANAVGLPGAATAMFVNRLTPPSYPATFTAVEIYFGNRANGLAPNSQITLVGATNPSGSASFSAATAGVFNQYNAGVTAMGVFNTYTLPTPITIASGDFVVGFAVSNPAGLFPADQDQLTKSQGRSYVSSDGVNFSVVDSFGANVAGNFGIRALVTLGGP